MQPRGLSTAVCLGLIVFLTPNAELSAKATPRAAPTQASTSANTSQKHAIKFYIVGAGALVATPEGDRLALTGYRSSDGVMLSVLHNTFDDDDESTKVFHNGIARATKVLVMGHATDGAGRAAGQRAQIIVKDPNKNEMLSEVLWTEGREFYEIFSPSTRDTLALENFLKQ
jgi:hypothetical protein